MKVYRIYDVGLWSWGVGRKNLNARPWDQERMLKDLRSSIAGLIVEA